MHVDFLGFDFLDDVIGNISYDNEVISEPNRLDEG